MLTGPVSTVKAMQDYFSNGKHGKKISMAEFKALTAEDKEDFKQMLISEGYTIE